MSADRRNFKKWSEVMSEYEDRIKLSNLTSNIDHTNIPTSFQFAKDVTTYIGKMASTSDAKARSGIVNEYITETLRTLAPPYITMWFYSMHNYDRCETWFGEPAAKNIILKAMSSAQATETSQEELLMYKTACANFRQYAANVLENATPIFKMPNEEVKKTVVVARSAMNQLQGMLTNIVRKRSEQLGGPVRTAATGRPPHVTHYIDFIEGREHTGVLPLLARRATGVGLDRCYDPKTKKWSIIRFEPTGNEKPGCLLATTAAIWLKQYKDKDWYPENKIHTEEMAIVIAELQAIEEGDIDLGGSNGGGGYLQQIANIDIVFNFFLWMHICGVTRADRSKINSALYLVGDKILGSDKIKTYLKSTTTKLRGLTEYINETGSIHIPPYAFTARRIYDFVAVFGVMKINDIESILHPGVSPRFVIHMKMTSPQAMAFITNYWSLESYYDKDTILESEHMFHQMLISKKSAYENSLNYKGDVFSVKFVPKYEPIGAPEIPLTMPALAEPLSRVKTSVREIKITEIHDDEEGTASDIATTSAPTGGASGRAISKHK